MGAHQLGLQAITRGEEARRAGDSDRAALAFAEARELFNQCGAIADEARTVARLAQIKRDAGHRDAACRLQTQAVALARESGDRGSYANTLRHLADLLREMDDARGAATLYREALEIYQAGPYSPLDTAHAMRGAALNAEQLGDKARARKLWRGARERYAVLDELMRATADDANPGVAEADRHLAELGDD